MFIFSVAVYSCSLLKSRCPTCRGERLEDVNNCQNDEIASITRSLRNDNKMSLDNKLGPERVFPRICLPKILAKFGWTFWCEFLLKPFVLCVESPNCSENSWEVFGWFFVIERLFRSPNKICTLKILLSWRFPRKTTLWGNCPLHPHAQPPSKVKILFLLLSRRLWITVREVFRRIFAMSAKHFARISLSRGLSARAHATGVVLSKRRASAF